MEGETERRKIRLWRVDVDEDEFREGLLDCVLGSVALARLPPPPFSSAYESISRLMLLRARVRAPAIIVELVFATSDAVVDERRAERLRITSSSTRRKGRYLLEFAAEEVAFGSFSLSFSLVVACEESSFFCFFGLSFSPFAADDFLLEPWVVGGSAWTKGVGYSHCAVEQWLAITATLLA